MGACVGLGFGPGDGSGIGSLVGANVGSGTGIPAAGPEDASCLSSSVGFCVNVNCGNGGALGIGGAGMTSKKRQDKGNGKRNTVVRRSFVHQ